MDTNHGLGYMKTNGTTTMISATAEIDQYVSKAQVSRMYYIAPLPLYREKTFSLELSVHRIVSTQQTSVTHRARDVTFTEFRRHEFLFHSKELV